ncbi:hypothetical protein P7C73_g1672, partial [Tremellales sp. Uapishka_1]
MTPVTRSIFNHYIEHHPLYLSSPRLPTRRLSCATLVRPSIIPHPRHFHRFDSSTDSAIDATTLPPSLSRTERPMKVEIVFDPNQIQSLASRVAPAAAPAARAQNGARGARGARGGGVTKPREPRAKPKTAEELDAEMAAYKTTSADA